MHRILPIAVVLVLLACFASPCLAQEDETAKLNARVAAFFEHLTSDEVEPRKAFEDLLATGPLSNDRDDDITKLVERYEALGKYGPFIAAEPVDAKAVGADLVLLTFLYKAENYPIVWRFGFYRRTGADWFVISLSFDTRIESLRK